MKNASPMAYSLAQKLLHWGMALMIFYNLIFSDSMEEWGRATRNGGVATPEQVSAANIHAYVGIALLVLALLRVILRVVQGAPEAPADEPPLFQLAAKLAHGAFYLLFILMPFTGIGRYYFGNETAGFLHAGPFKIVLWALIVVHIAAIPIHRLLWKSNIMPRMTSGRP
nr:cytochrome b/b6 domain-containing protein [uncultured Gellertiella sp.]